MHNLAMLYLRGVNGVEKDAVRAKELFQQTAERSHVPSMSNLATLFHHGTDGIPSNHTLGRELY